MRPRKEKGSQRVAVGFCMEGSSNVKSVRKRRVSATMEWKQDSARVREFFVYMTGTSINVPNASNQNV
jgi:hypothetical protein